MKANKYPIAKLEPCPFCGKEPELVEEYEHTGLHEGGYHWIVRCNFLKGGCGAKGPGRIEKEEAVKLWQARYRKNCCCSTNGAKDSV